MTTHDSMHRLAEEGYPWLERLVLVFEEIDTLFESCAHFT